MTRIITDLMNWKLVTMTQSEIIIHINNNYLLHLVISNNRSISHKTFGPIPNSRLDPVSIFKILVWGISLV